MAAPPPSSSSSRIPASGRGTLEEGCSSTLSCVTDSNRTPAQRRERALAPGIPMATDCQNRQMVMEIIEVAGSLLSQADDDAHHRKKEAELTRIRGLAARGRQRAKS